MARLGQLEQPDLRGQLVKKDRRVKMGNWAKKVKKAPQAQVSNGRWSKAMAHPSSLSPVVSQYPPTSPAGTTWTSLLPSLAMQSLRMCMTAAFPLVVLAEGRVAGGWSGAALLP